MKNAWIDGGTIRDTCVGDPTILFTPEIAARYSTEVPDDTEIGDVLVNGGWAKPVITPPPPAVITPSKVHTQLEFLNKFTDAELVGIYTAAKASVAIEVFLAKFNAATNIDLSDPRTIAGVMALEAGGLLSAGRGAAILA